MNKTQINAIASELLKAEKEKKPVDPLSARFPGITVAEAYAVQLEVIRRKVASGALIVGKKIGLTSKAMQDMFGVREPDYGHILNTAVIPESQPLGIQSLIQPRVESEICFVLKKGLKGPGVTVAEVLSATQGVFPSFEIIDSRIRDWKIKVHDSIADNASNAAVVLGGKMTEIEDLDLRYVGLVLEKNGEVVSTAAGAAVLGNPAEAVSWLANKLAEYGVELKSGEFIMSGSLTAAFPAKAGDSFKATFDRLGGVSVRFVA